MNIELITFSGYGMFVWPAFIFTLLCFFVLYFKTYKELKKQEKIFLAEYEQLPTKEVEIEKQREISKEVLSGTFTF